MHGHHHEVTLGLSFLLGAVHALEPGHGKTAMLVYLTGEKRGFWHPVVMGLSTALSHSTSLLAIAFAVHWAHHLTTGDHVHEEHASVVLQWVSAVLIVGVGAIMLVRAQAGRVTPCCSTHGCSHRTAASATVQIGDLSTTNDERPARGYVTTALLGVAVGLLPCPSALAAYFAGLSSGTPALAYLTIGLFGAGIAVSLSLVGMILQRFRWQLTHNRQHLPTLPWAVIRASLILAVGLFYLGRVALF